MSENSESVNEIALKKKAENAAILQRARNVRAMNARENRIRTEEVCTHRNYSINC